MKIVAAPSEHSLDHLCEDAKLRLAQSDEDRIFYIRSDIWVPYRRGVEILKRLTWLYGGPKKVRPPCLLIYGESFNGKTWIKNRFLASRLAKDCPDAEAVSIPVIDVEMPPGPGESRIYRAILTRIGSVGVNRKDPDAMCESIVNSLRQVGTRMLLIDEIQHVIGAGKSTRNTLDAIKGLSNRLQIPIVLFGTLEALNALATEEQLKRRFTPVLLPKFSNTDEFTEFLLTFESKLPLREASGFRRDERLCTKVFDLTEGLMGNIGSLLAAAAERAVRTGEERITTDILAKVAPDDPWRRKR